MHHSLNDGMRLYSCYQLSHQEKRKRSPSHVRLEEISRDTGARAGTVYGGRVHPASRAHRHIVCHPQRCDFTVTLTKWSRSRGLGTQWRERHDVCGGWGALQTGPPWRLPLPPRDDHTWPPRHKLQEEIWGSLQGRNGYAAEHLGGGMICLTKQTPWTWERNVIPLLSGPGECSLCL